MEAKKEVQALEKERPIKQANFIWSQTALKDLENETTCPDRWRAVWIDKEFKLPTNQAQSLGKYFEEQCLEMGATDDAPTELKKTSTGKKTVAQERIEIQAKKFKSFFDRHSENYLGYEILSVQKPVTGEINNLPVRGVIDFVAVDVETGKEVIFDLKLTADAYNDFSEFGYGNDIANLDLVQQVLYRELYKQEFGIVADVGLLIFEHGPKMRIRLLKLNITEERVNDLLERFDVAKEVVDLYITNGWTKTPSEQECKNCKLDCPLRINESNLSIEEFNY